MGRCVEGNDRTHEVSFTDTVLHTKRIAGIGADVADLTQFHAVFAAGKTIYGKTRESRLPFAQLSGGAERVLTACRYASILEAGRFFIPENPCAHHEETNETSTATGFLGDVLLAGGRTEFGGVHGCAHERFPGLQL